MLIHDIILNNHYRFILYEKAEFHNININYYINENFNEYFYLGFCS